MEKAELKDAKLNPTEDTTRQILEYAPNQDIPADRVHGESKHQNKEVDTTRDIKENQEHYDRYKDEGLVRKPDGATTEQHTNSLEGRISPKAPTANDEETDDLHNLNQASLFSTHSFQNLGDHRLVTSDAQKRCSFPHVRLSSFCGLFFQSVQQGSCELQEASGPSALPDTKIKKTSQHFWPTSAQTHISAGLGTPDPGYLLFLLVNTTKEAPPQPNSRNRA